MLGRNLSIPGKHKGTGVPTRTSPAYLLLFSSQKHRHQRKVPLQLLWVCVQVRLGPYKQINQWKTNIFWERHLKMWGISQVKREMVEWRKMKNSLNIPSLAWAKIGCGQHRLENLFYHRQGNSSLVLSLPVPFLENLLSSTSVEFTWHLNHQVLFLDSIYHSLYLDVYSCDTVFDVCHSTRL